MTNDERQEHREGRNACCEHASSHSGSALGMSSDVSDSGCGPLRTNVLVIGAGQAGLAAANELKKAGVDYLLVDAAAAVGDSWRQRYETLTLFTPRSISSLPGLPLPGDTEGYATKDEFAAYLARYAKVGGHRIETGTRISALRRKHGVFEAVSSDGRIYAAPAVIVATGPFSVPRVPAMVNEFPDGIQQIHVSDFWNAESVAEGTVLLVGDGASGRDAALALAASHRVLLARGRPRKLFPERILGQSTWWWLKRLGLLGAKPDSIIGRRMRRIDPFPNRGNDDATLVRKNVVLMPRLVSVDGCHAVFADGSREAPQAVVWAAGYRDEFDWIKIEGAVDAEGRLLHQEGVSPVPGLYFVGRPWQRNRASALIAGAGDDAAFVVGTLMHSVRSRYKTSKLLR
ncbi:MULTISPECIES: flavin-containing monooxygenase [Pseudorhizobium]|nr:MULTISPECIES: NAD(P)/FAD-dependent oxidoreductase [Pseudorhizobium]MBB6182467.1 putative flavoprotein involved in K+ transport [Pseudorhizobium flavum]CCF22200.1 Putative FAD-dependent momooxyxegase involved in K+ transport; CzcO/ArsO-like [Pseudorhizobium banfieldiae]